jgi:hypothetical protein
MFYPVLSIQHTASDTTTWESPVDCNLVGFHLSVACSISKDPADTATNVLTPTTKRITESILMASGTLGIKVLPVKIPISKGTRLIVSTSGAGTTSLLFEIPAENGATPT